MSSFIQESRLSSIMARIPVFANATRVSPVAGGLTNSNYRVDTPAQTYLLRVSDSTAGLLRISRENELINTERAHKAGVGAPVIDSLPDENVLVIGWIEAKTLHAEDIRSQTQLLPRFANSLKMLHSGPEFQGVLHFPSLRKRYLKLVQSAGYFLPDQYLSIEHLVLDLEKALESDPEILVPCNNDLLAENFMDDGKKIWIIDYEYSGQNEASFEIGNFAGEISLSDEQLTDLCNAYWQKHIPSKIARAMAWSMIARYGWVLWASIQEAISSINFDFRSWGMVKWDSVLPEFHGNRYQKVINILKKSFHE